MTPLLRALLLLLPLLAAEPARGQEQIHLGPFTPGMSVREAMSAMPGIEWEEIRHYRSGQLVGAYAHRAVEFNGATWDVGVGDVLGGRAGAVEHNLSLRRTLPASRTEQCPTELSQAVAALEPTLGVFGGHPDFSRFNSRLYRNPTSRGFDIMPVGDRSIARAWLEENGVQPMETFREPDEAFAHRVEIRVDIWRPAGGCSVQISIYRD